MLLRNRFSLVERRRYDHRSQPHFAVGVTSDHFAPPITIHVLDLVPALLRVILDDAGHQTLAYYFPLQHFSHFSLTAPFAARLCALAKSARIRSSKPVSLNPIAFALVVNAQPVAGSALVGARRARSAL
jgi:hypothetical protein